MDKLDFLELYGSKHEFSEDDLRKLSQTIFKDHKIKFKIDSEGIYSCKERDYNFQYEGYIEKISIAKIGKLHPRYFILEWRTYYDYNNNVAHDFLNQPKEVKEIVKEQTVKITIKNYIDIESNSLVYHNEPKIIYN